MIWRLQAVAALLLAGCARSTPPAAVAPEPTAGVPGLFGTLPATQLPAPEFNAINSDGASRTREDLIGAPHVLWFFPISGTPG